MGFQLVTTSITCFTCNNVCCVSSLYKLNFCCVLGYSGDIGLKKRSQMDARMAVTHVVAQSGKTAKDVSLEMGLTSNFITNTKARKSAPRLDTFARIAEVCGYEVVLRGHGEEITIEYRGDE